MPNVKHHEQGDRRSIDSTIRGSWRASRTDVAGRTFVRLRSDGGLKPHSDIDLLVTVTVNETTRRALINDLLETSASPGESEILRQ